MAAPGLNCPRARTVIAASFILATFFRALPLDLVGVKDLILCCLSPHRWALCLLPVKLPLLRQPSAVMVGHTVKASPYLFTSVFHFFPSDYVSVAIRAVLSLPAERHPLQASVLLP